MVDALDRGSESGGGGGRGDCADVLHRGAYGGTGDECTDGSGFRGGGGGGRGRVPAFVDIPPPTALLPTEWKQYVEQLQSQMALLQQELQAVEKLLTGSPNPEVQPPPTPAPPDRVQVGEKEVDLPEGSKLVKGDDNSWIHRAVSGDKSEPVADVDVRDDTVTWKEAGKTHVVDRHTGAQLVIDDSKNPPQVELDDPNGKDLYKRMSDALTAAGGTVPSGSLSKEDVSTLMDKIQSIPGFPQEVKDAIAALVRYFDNLPPATSASEAKITLDPPEA